MADKPKEVKKTEQPEEKQGVSRRDFIVGAGAGVAGLVVGGAVGYKVLPQPTAPSTPLPETWIGRNIANQNCMGCRLCQVACSQIKEQKIWPGISRVTVPQYYPGVEFPVLCYQCGDEAKCIEACKVGALSLDTSKKLNTIKVDTSKCLRTTQGADCTLCADQCPGSAVTFHPVSKAPLICDLCGGDPACVKACTKQTLTLKGVRMAAVKPEDIAAALAETYKVAAQTKAAIPQNPFARADKDLNT